MTGERRSDREGGARSTSQRSHARDLRVAAAVSTGLVAGILAVGILVAPVAKFHVSFPDQRLAAVSRGNVSPATMPRGGEISWSSVIRL